MQKNNVKNFVCSFLFSILAVFCIQKLFLRTPVVKKADTDQNIKVEKIQLFSEKSAPKDDIVLNKVAVNEVDVSDISALTAEPVTKEKEIKEAPSPVVALSNETPQNEVAVSTDLAFASEISLSDEDIEEIKDMDNHVKSGIVYAQNDLSVSNTSDDEEIPLIENTEQKHQYINVSNASSASQIAMVEPDVLVNTIEESDILNEEKDLAEADIKNSELGEIFALSQNQENIDVDESAWQTAEIGASSKTDDLEQTQDEDSPWVVAKGNKFAKNQAAVEEFSKDLPQSDEQTESEDENIETRQTPDEQVISQTFIEPLLKEKEQEPEQKLAYQMIQNILIPIPEDILNDADLTPDLTATPEGKKPEKKTVIITEEEQQLSENEKESGLFKSISSWFGKNKDSNPQTTIKKDSKQKPKTSSKKSVKQKVLSALGQEEEQEDPTPIMPAELRLSFQPNRAEISGQTLKWIYAFADNARDNDDVYIEVRMDGTSSYALQQKRLNLLSSIFSSRGVDYRKVNTIFTSREPNSFIIRNIRFNNKEKEREQTIYTGEWIECP